MKNLAISVLCLGLLSSCGESLSSSYLGQESIYSRYYFSINEGSQTVNVKARLNLYRSYFLKVELTGEDRLELNGVPMQLESNRFLGDVFNGDRYTAKSNAKRFVINLFTHFDDETEVRSVSVKRPEQVTLKKLDDGNNISVHLNVPEGYEAECKLQGLDQFGRTLSITEEADVNGVCQFNAANLQEEGTHPHEDDKDIIKFMQFGELKLSVEAEKAYMHGERTEIYLRSNITPTTVDYTPAKS